MGKLVVVILAATVILGCNTFDPFGLYDEQFIKIEFKSGNRNEVNTFEEFLKKDLVLDGTIKVTFSLSEDEQTSILKVVQEAGFFSFPDTLRSREGVMIEPDPGLQKLRIKYGNQEKTVIWFYPLTDPEFILPMEKIVLKIREVVEANHIYRRLPPARGGYI